MALPVVPTLLQRALRGASLGVPVATILCQKILPAF
jgi:hypothetical protein